MTTGRYWVIVGLVMLIGVSFIGSVYRDYLPLQHIPTAIALAVFLTLSRKYPLSNLSFACVAIFLLLHVLGARYVYSNVPYDEWSQAIFGKSISETFGWTRNHYDRFVHFMYGVLFYIPYREVAIRFMGLSPKKVGYFTLEFIIASSTIYELLEWIIAVVMAPDQAEAYNGQQGDMWDAQKDTLMAIAGAVLVMLIRRFAARRKTIRGT